MDFLLWVAVMVIDLFGKPVTLLWGFISWKTDSFLVRKTGPFAAHQCALQSKLALCTYWALQPWPVSKFTNAEGRLSKTSTEMQLSFNLSSWNKWKKKILAVEQALEGSWVLSSLFSCHGKSVRFAWWAGECGFLPTPWNVNAMVRMTQAALWKLLKNHTLSSNLSPRSLKLIWETELSASVWVLNHVRKELH